MSKIQKEVWVVFSIVIGIFVFCLCIAGCGGGGGGGGDAPANNTGGSTPADNTGGDNNAWVVPWPMLGQNPRHAGQSPYAGTSIPTLKWQQSSFDGVSTQSVIGANGTIIALNYFFTDTIIAVNPNDGSVKWVYSIDEEQAVKTILHTPSIDGDGVIYFHDTDGIMYALNPDGTLKWKNTLNVYDTPLTIGTDGNMYAVDIIYLDCIGSDGSLKWSYKPSDTRVADLPPAIGTDGTIYIGVENNGVDGNGSLVALFPDGSLKWRYYLDDPIDAWKSGVSPTIAPAIGLDGTIHIGTFWNFYAINSNGTLKWQIPTGGRNFKLSVPSVSSDGTVYVDTQDGLSAINSFDGSIKWSFSDFDSVGDEDSIAIDSNGVVYAGSVSYLYALNPDGTEKWRYYNAFDYFSSPKIGADGTVYAHHNVSWITALGQ